MRNSRPILLCILLLLSCIPLHLLKQIVLRYAVNQACRVILDRSSDGSGGLSPFEAALSEESEEIKITDAIAQQQEIASWKIDSAWTGSYPSATWEFTIDYLWKTQVY